MLAPEPVFESSRPQLEPRIADHAASSLVQTDRARDPLPQFRPRVTAGHQFEVRLPQVSAQRITRQRGFRPQANGVG
jgi:hypothetical protein